MEGRPRLSSGCDKLMATRGFSKSLFKETCGADKLQPSGPMVPLDLRIYVL